MIAIGMGLLFLSYCGLVLGYCWVRGYNVTYTDLFRSTWPGTTKAAS